MWLIEKGSGRKLEKKAVSGIMLILLLTGMLTLAFNIQPVKAEPTTIVVPDDYPTIQEAINAAKAGDTICVRAGTYYENLVVNKSVTLIGENRDSTIIDGSERTIVVLITADEVVIKGFTVQNGGWTDMEHAGVAVRDAMNVKIQNNIIKRNDEGVVLLSALNCIVVENLIFDNYCPGIEIEPWWYPLARYYGKSNNNTIHKNTIKANFHGLFLSQTFYNTIVENNISESIQMGVWLDSSSNNKFYHNNILNNTRAQVYSWNSTNIWDDGYPSGGNYWSDYSGVDEFSGPNQDQPGSDGIGDTPYVIDADNQDRYPLMNPLTLPHFSITASPTSLTIQQGDSDTSVISIMSIGGFNQSVQLTVSGAPSGVTTALNPEQVTPPPDGSTTSTLTVSVDTTATLGSYTLTVTGTSGTLTHSVDIFLEIKTVPPPEAFPQAGKFYTLVGRRVGWVIADEKNTTYHGEEIYKWSVQDVVGDVAFVNRTWVYVYISPQTGENWTDTYDYDYEIATDRTIQSAYGKVMSFTTTGFWGSAGWPLDEDVGEHTWAWFPTDLYIGAEVLVSWTGDSSFLDDMPYEVVGEEVIQILDEKQDCWMLRMPPSITTDGVAVRMEAYWVDKDTGVPLKLYGKEWALDGSSGWAYEYVLVHTNINLGPESTKPPSPTYTLTIPTTPGFPEAGKFYTWYYLDEGWYMSDTTNVIWYEEGLLSRWVVNITDDEALVYTIFWQEDFVHARARELEYVFIWYIVYRIDITTREILEVGGSSYYVNMTSLTYDGPVDLIPSLAGDVGEETDCWLPTNLYLGAAVNISWLSDKMWRLDNATYTVVDEETISALGESQACWVLYLPSTPSIDGTLNWSETYYSDKDTGIPLTLVGETWAVNGGDASKYAMQLIDTNVNLVPAPQDQLPTCSIKLLKDGVEIDEVDVWQFFDIYVGDSTDDTGIKQVRFSSDDSQDGNPTGEWTDWYDWDISQGDWNASTKIKRWAFATGGDKEVWAEVKDDIGQTAKCSANIYAIGPPPTDTTPPDTKITDGPSGTIDYNDVTFTWTGSDDVTPVSELVYLYYLEGYDSDWSDWTPETSKQFTDLPNGDYTLKVKAKDQAGNIDPTSAERSFTISITVPHIDSITPSSGAPGIEVTIKGLNLKRLVIGWVDFGGQQITTNIKSWSDTEVVVKVPPGKGTVNVKVVPDMQESNSIQFTYNDPFIDWIDPTSGRPGEEVTISGKDFGYKDLSPSFWVKFGKSLTYTTSWTDTKIVAEAPSDYGFGIKDKMMIIQLIKYAVLGWMPIEEAIKEIFEDILTDLLLHGVRIPVGEGRIEVDVRVRTPTEQESNAKMFTYIVDEIVLSELLSPGELRIYDSQGRVTGLVNGQVKEEIPYSYYANNTILIVYPSDSYRYEVVGTEEGTYELRVTSGKVGEATTFTATNIPTSSNAIHQYIIDWGALSRGEEGVTLKVDSDGDGVFELTFTSDSELTRDEFMLHVAPAEAFPVWIVGVAVAAIAIATVAIAVLWRRRKQLPTKG